MHPEIELEDEAAIKTFGFVPGFLQHIGRNEKKVYHIQSDEQITAFAARKSER